MTKYQKSCTTCSFAIMDSSYRQICRNELGKHFEKRVQSGAYYYSYRGQSCHSKKGETTVSNDYIEYQKGAIKLKLSNNKMSISMNVNNAPFNTAEKTKIEKDLADVFEVVTLASQKIPAAKESSAVSGIEL